MRFHGLRVLVVEDDPDVRRYVVTLLTGQGCDVVAAPDGVTALAAIEAARPVGDFAVILLDRHLPDGDGLQFLQNIRRAGVQTPVIIATGYPDLDHAREAGALGAAAYLLARRLGGKVQGDLLAAALAVIAERTASETAPPHLLHALARAAATPELCVADFIGVSTGLALLTNPAPSPRATRQGLERLTRLMRRSPQVDEYLDAIAAPKPRKQRELTRPTPIRLNPSG